MSFQATSLVARPGITKNPTEGCLLLFLAQHMTADGRRAWPSQDTIAAFMGCSTRTVRRTLAALEARGVIVRGDQGAVKHLPPHRRPVVWDLGPTVRDDQKAPARAHNGRTRVSYNQSPLNPLLTVVTNRYGPPRARRRPPRRTIRHLAPATARLRRSGDCRTTWQTPTSGGPPPTIPGA